MPWAYVFADYSVTGLDASAKVTHRTRRCCRKNAVDTTYIDDFTRASRDELEWWKLASLSKRLSKRMIGASDGFNLSDPNWDIWITIYGLVSRLYTQGPAREGQARHERAARRGDNLGRLRSVSRQARRFRKNGNVVRDKDSLPYATAVSTR